MSSFQRYKEPPAADKQNILESGIRIDKSNFVELYSAGAAWSAVTQKRANEIVVRGRDWYIDFSAGVIRFGLERYPFQIIGTESETQGTWLWGWANDSAGNGETLKLSLRMLSLGEQWGLEAFTEPQFELSRIYNGFTLACAAAALSEKPVCFFRCPHETGAVFVTFGLLPKSVFEPVGAEAFASVLISLAQNIVADHRIMAEGFLYSNRTDYHFEDGVLVAKFPQSPPIAVSFDEYHRISSIGFQSAV